MANRCANGTRCPVCFGQAVLPGLNDLATTDPTVAELWHPDNDLTPTEVKRCSTRKVLWRCPLNHEWSATVANRTNRGSGCPVCSGRTVQPGFNDLETKRPELAQLWHPENGINPSQVSAFSQRRYKWRCSLGHEWVSSVAAVQNLAFPYCAVCSGRKVLNGFNDLAATHRELAAQWSQNNNRRPDETSAGSERVVEWNCANGHTWRTSVKERTRGRGCPRCAQGITCSRGETELADFVREVLPRHDVITNCRNTLPSGKELDIVIPDLGIAIEFNGIYYHSDEFVSRAAHLNKYLSVRSAGLHLLQVWEDDWRDRREHVEAMVASALGVVRRGDLRVSKLNTKTVSREELNSLRGGTGVGLEIVNRLGQQVVGLFTAAGNPAAIIQLTKRDNRFQARYIEIVHVRGGTLSFIANNDRLEGRDLATNGYRRSSAIPPKRFYVSRNTRFLHEPTVVSERVQVAA